jgi:thymidylate synthase
MESVVASNAINIKDLQLICAVSSDGVIGINQQLPWDIPGDMAHFRKTTDNSIVIMGGNTWISLKAPLTNRINVVITRRQQQQQQSKQSQNHGGAVFFCDMPNLVDCLEAIEALHGPKAIFVIGGCEVYRQLMPFVKTLHITHIEKSMLSESGNKTLFPGIPDTARLVSSSPVYSEGDITYRFLKYDTSGSGERMSFHQYRGERGYLQVCQYILRNGDGRSDRTGTGTLSTFGVHLWFDISRSVPLLTTKRMYWRSCIEELLWFLRGDTDAKNLSTKGVKIWDANSSSAFQNSVGLGHLEPGDCGANYSFQWRHFGADYVDCKADYIGQGIDQINGIVEQLKTDPFSRRIFLSAWNPADLKKTVLPPCHVSAQFYVSEPKEPGEPLELSCQVYQRSADMFLGVPFNIFSYACLTYILALKVGMRPKNLILCLGDAHIYKNHLEAMTEQISREPTAPPQLNIQESVKCANWEGLDVSQFELVGYIFKPAIRAPMAV